jgi:hypothetical protein
MISLFQCHPASDSPAAAVRTMTTSCSRRRQLHFVAGRLVADPTSASPGKCC